MNYTPLRQQDPCGKRAVLEPYGGHVGYLDGLRGLAIMAVIMVHSSLGLELGTPLRNLTFYGVRGVQLFFVVSGMTLMMSHINRPLNLANFAARRFFRIAPMFYLGIVIYLAIGAWTSMPIGDRTATPVDFLATLTFLNGWLPHDSSLLVPGGWSIGAEAMLYVVFPAILALANRRGVLFAFVTLSYIVAGAAHLVLVRIYPSISMTFWVCQLPAFAGGCLLAIVADKIPSRNLALTVLWGSIVGLIIDTQLHGHSNLLVAILLLTVFVWAVSHVRPDILQSKPLTYLGRISFSIYILHFAILGIIETIWSAVAPSTVPIAEFAIIYLTTLAVSVGLSTLTYTYIERPCVRIGRMLFHEQRASTG